MGTSEELKATALFTTLIEIHFSPTFHLVENLNKKV